MNHIDPTREQFEAFTALPRHTPILMLNLIRLNETAVYPNGETCSGAEAYQRYGDSSISILRSAGGEIAWRGRQECVLTGPTEKLWDIAFIASYPSAEVFLTMVKSPEYQAILIHRTVAVEDSRLIRFAPEIPGDGFAG